MSQTPRERIGERIAYELDWPGYDVMRGGGTIVLMDRRTGREYKITVEELRPLYN